MNQKSSGKKDVKIPESKITDLIIDFMKKSENGNWHPEKIKRVDGRRKGADIRFIGGKRNSEYFVVECKGKSDAKSADSINKEGWLNALGQLITRMDVERLVKSKRTGEVRGINRAYKYGLGLYWVGVQKALERIPYAAAKVLNLYMFSVNDNLEVKKFTPKDFGRKHKNEEFL